MHPIQLIPEVLKGSLTGLVVSLQFLKELLSGDPVADDEVLDISVFNDVEALFHVGKVGVCLGADKGV